MVLLVLLVIVAIEVGLGVALFVTGGALFLPKDQDDDPSPRDKSDQPAEKRLQIERRSPR